MLQKNTSPNYTKWCSLGTQHAPKSAKHPSPKIYSKRRSKKWTRKLLLARPDLAKLREGSRKSRFQISYKRQTQDLPKAPSWKLFGCPNLKMASEKASKTTPDNCSQQCETRLPKRSQQATPKNKHDTRLKIKILLKVWRVANVRQAIRVLILCPRFESLHTVVEQKSCIHINK